LDTRHKGEVDLKFRLTKEECIGLVGIPAYDRLKEIYGKSPDEIWLRRAQYEGPSQGINWHLDHSTRTMQVALNGDKDYKGGKLVFAHNKKIHVPSRDAGTATIHGGDTVHAVTPIKSGTRYGLFFLHLPSENTNNLELEFNVHGNGK